MYTKLQWKGVDPYVLLVELTIAYISKIAWLFYYLFPIWYIYDIL